jgi:hypothetical protein
MYVVTINKVPLYHGTRPACVSYATAHGLNASVIKYIAIPKHSRGLYYFGDLSCLICMFVIITAFISALI